MKSVSRSPTVGHACVTAGARNETRHSSGDKQNRSQAAVVCSLGRLTQARGSLRGACMGGRPRSKPRRDVEAQSVGGADSNMVEDHPGDRPLGVPASLLVTILTVNPQLLSASSDVPEQPKQAVGTRLAANHDKITYNVSVIGVRTLLRFSHSPPGPLFRVLMTAAAVPSDCAAEE